MWYALFSLKIVYKGTNLKLHFLSRICQFPKMNYLTAVVRLPVQLIWAWPGSTTPSQLVSPVVKPQLTLQILLWLLTLLIITTGNLQTWNCRSIFIRLLLFLVIWTKIWIGNFSLTSASFVQQKNCWAICHLREKISDQNFLILFILSNQTFLKLNWLIWQDVWP